MLMLVRHLLLDWHIACGFNTLDLLNRWLLLMCLLQLLLLLRLVLHHILVGLIVYLLVGLRLKGLGLMMIV